MSSETTGPAPEQQRWVTLTKTGADSYAVTNRRGGVLPIGRGPGDFTPVELMLAALAGCGAIDLDLITRKRATAETFDMRVEANKTRDELGNRLVDLTVVVDLRFPEGEAGDRAREFLPRALAQTRDRLCTVGRTIAVESPVEYVQADLA